MATAENVTLLFLAFVFLSICVGIKADGCQQFSLTSPPMGTYSCPGSNITYTCVLSSSAPFAVITAWTGSAFQCPPTNLISLLQRSSGAITQFTPVPCGSLSAVTTNVTNITSPCYTSVLTIPAVQALNGTTVICQDGSTGAVVGSDTVKIITSPGAPSGLQFSSLCTNSLTIQWTPASSGYNASSYNISATSGTTVGTRSVAGDTTMTTIGDLIDGTNYTVSVAAINCAGSSNSSSVSVQTLSCAPVSVNVTTVLYQNNSVYDLELFWTHRQQSCSVPQYTVMVTSATSTDTYMVADTYCTSSSCLYIVGMSGASVSSYNVSVACRNTLNQIGQPYVAMQSVPNPVVLSVDPPKVSGNSATIYCTFLAGSSYYCMVCCSTDPSVPVGLAGSGYLSSTNGSTVNVSLQDLTSGQMYYCKAAATNTNSNNCTGPVVGGVKVFFSFNTSSLPTLPPSPSPTPPSPDNTGTIVGVVVGVVVGVGVGGCGACVVIVVVVVMWKNKGGKGKKREDTVELGKSTPPPAPSDGTGALYQDPNAIKHTQAPGGEVYAMADKPTKTSKASADKSKKPTATVAPADGGGAVYQDPKDIQHTTVAGGETYAVADKKPKSVDHVASPAGDLYAVADNKQPKRK